MTLPELRFMRDRPTRNRCKREAKHRVLSQMPMRQRGFLFIGFFLAMGILSRRSNLEILSVLVAVVVCGPSLYWLANRNRLRRSLRDLIRQTTGCCPSCGYDLEGNHSGDCPECGTKYATVQ